MRIKLGAVIPTVQYGNIQPEFEMDVDDPDQGLKILEGKIQELWEKYADKPLAVSNAKTKLTAFVGGEIYYDDLSHTYTNEQGEVYLSGSTYAKQFEKPFDKVAISNAIAKKFDADPQAIMDMWELKGDISRTFGTAMHKALELYGRYDGLAKAIDKQTNLHDHPIIKRAVESFYVGRSGQKAEYEVFVVDHKEKHAGQIDRLLITGDKTCRVQDFKTNATIEKSLPVYWKQLEFYARILEAAGWTVEGLDIFWWNGEWHIYNQEIKEE